MHVLSSSAGYASGGPCEGQLKRDETGEMWSAHDKNEDCGTLETCPFRPVFDVKGLAFTITTKA
jgi:hypothetical protein